MKENRMMIILRKKISSALIFAFLAAITAVMLVPFFMMILSSFLPPSDLFQMRLSLDAGWGRLTLDNFRTLFNYRNGEYLLWFKNSIVIMLVQTALGLALSSMVGYGLAMYEFRLRKVTLLLVLVFMMTPFEILMVPLYREVFALGLLDTYAGVLLPSVVTPFMIFFFRQAASGLPKELADAARMDGCGEFRIYLTVMVPLMRPAFGAMGIMQALGSWNNFLWPLIVLNSPEKTTLPIGISGFVSNHGDTYDILLASATCAIIPVLVLFLAFQKSFIAGLTVGGVKE